MAVGTANKGKAQRSNSQRGKLRKPNLDAYYGQKIRRIEPGGFEFRVQLVRPEKPRTDRYLLLDRALTMLDWSDADSSVLTGNLAVRRPSPAKVGAIPILAGHRIRLQLFWDGRWRRVWDMRVGEPPTIDPKTGEITAAIADDLSGLQLNEREWDFKKDKAHPHGWTADEVTREVCKKEKVRPGSMPKGKRKIKRIKLKGSGLEVIRKAWALEKQKTGLRYVVRFRDTRLQVTRFGRPGTLYTIKGIEKEMGTGAEQPTKKPVTSIKATGRIKIGGKWKKVTETVRSHRAIARFGFVEKEHDYGHMDSREELRREATRDLAENLKVNRTMTLTVPGIPFLEKGSTVKVITNEPGWHGKVGTSQQDRAFAFVTSARHSLSAASYDTELELSQDDPYLADRERRDEEKRDKKKKERGKPKAKAGG